MFYGRAGFYAAEEVAPHPVGTRYIGVFRAVVVEIVNARMFELAADNRADADVFRQAFHLRPQGAHAAYDQINLYAGRTGGVKFFDDVRFDQRIEFGDDAGLPAGFGVFGFAADACNQHFVQGERALVQFVQAAGLAQAGDFHKQGVHVGGNLLVGGEEAEIGIDARSALVVVAGAEVRIAFQTAFFAADNQSHFGMDFVAEYTVYDMRARVFEPLRPIDVVCFVEARHQFHNHRYLLARQCGVHQCLGQFGVGTCAVDGHFNGDDSGVGRSFADKADDGFE